MFNIHRVIRLEVDTRGRASFCYLHGRRCSRSYLLPRTFREFALHFLNSEEKVGGKGGTPRASLFSGWSPALSAGAWVAHPNAVVITPCLPENALHLTPFSLAILGRMRGFVQVLSHTTEPEMGCWHTGTNLKTPLLGKTDVLKSVSGIAWII